MPQRTNDFQKLVSLVQKALVPSGAKVTDSALIDVPGMGEPREIDVLIEDSVGPYHMKIAVEAKDNRRKMDSTQFESLMGKYFVDGGIKVNKVVVVTHNGFYDPVIQRAEQLGVDLMTLSEATDVDWRKFAPAIKPFKTYPRICEIEVFPPVSQVTNEELYQLGQVVCSHRTTHGNLYQFASRIFLQNVLRNQEAALRQIDEAAALAMEGKKGKVEYKPDHPHVIRLRGQEYPLEKLTFIVHFTKRSAPQPAAQSEFRFQFAPHICKVDVKPAISVGTPQELRREGHLVCTCCGKDHGILNAWASKEIGGVFQRQPELVKQLLDGAQQSQSGEAWLTGEWPIKSKNVVRFRGVDYPVSSISIGVHAISAKAPLACKHYELSKPDGEGSVVSHMQATAGGKQFDIVIPHTEDGHPQKIVLKIDNAAKRDSNSGSSGHRSD